MSVGPRSSDLTSALYRLFAILTPLVNIATPVELFILAQHMQQLLFPQLH